MNDAEIKIMETANKDLGSTAAHTTLNIFTDRVTCAYCQEVAFRVLRAPYSIPNKIHSPIKPLLDGGPYYSGERIDHEMVIRILNRVPQACGN